MSEIVENRHDMPGRQSGSHPDAGLMASAFEKASSRGKQYRLLMSRITSTWMRDKQDRRSPICRKYARSLILVAGFWPCLMRVPSIAADSSSGSSATMSVGSKPAAIGSGFSTFNSMLPDFCHRRPHRADTGRSSSGNHVFFRSCKETISTKPSTQKLSAF